MSTLYWVLALVFLLPLNCEASSISSEGFTFNGTAFFSVIGGIYCIYLGYNLFLKGITHVKSDVQGEVTNKIKFEVKDAAPGIVFMVFGALIIMISAISSFI